MKLSVITINYNNASGLQKTTDSVLEQTWNNFEYIVIDGGSTDGSKEYIENYNDKLTYWVSEPDKGIYNAMNKGIEKANGEYLLFLNSGDYLNNPHVIEKLLQGSNNEDIVYGDIIFISETENSLYQYPNILCFDFFIHNTLPHPCTLIKKELFHLYGYYKEDIKICADWAFFLDMVCRHNVTYKHLPITVTTFALGGMSSEPGSDSIIKNEKENYLEKNYLLFYKDNLRLYQYVARLQLLQYSRLLKLFKIVMPIKIKQAIYQAAK